MVLEATVGSPVRAPILCFLAGLGFCPCTNPLRSFASPLPAPKFFLAFHYRHLHVPQLIIINITMKTITFILLLPHAMYCAKHLM